jgi:hypothetical protein
MPAPLPALPYADWRPTRDTIHRWAQIVGKIRLATAPRRDHWWHVSLRPTPRGLTTGLIPNAVGGFEIEFDFVEHALDVRTAAGEATRIPLRDGLSVAGLYETLFARLADFGVRPRIRATSYDLTPSLAFAKDRRHATYDAEAAARFGAVLRWVAGVFEEFAGRFRGKTSPVHFFWHSFDLAVTRFSGRAAPPEKGATAVEREAYSDEVASFGFWPGDSDVKAANFYAYAAPVPGGLTRERLAKPARWLPEGGMALLSYDAMRKSRNPRATLLDFLESAFRAAWKRADWAAAQGAPSAAQGR